MGKGYLIDLTLIIFLGYFLDLVGGSFNLQVVIGGIGNHCFGGAAENGAKITVGGEALHLSGEWRT